MTDLTTILPSFPVSQFAGLLPRLEQRLFTTTDLLTLHPSDIAKQAQVPLLDLKRFIAAVQTSLNDDLGPPRQIAYPKEAEDGRFQGANVVSTLNDDLDRALGGGVPVGCITEFAGESGAGKTQMMLSLCLAVQLPSPRGLSKKALYISTEAALATRRLSQMMASNPVLQSYEAEERPSLDNILSTITPDLESQDHILEVQVPVMLQRHNIGLIIMDSVAANYRAEFERQGSHGSNMAARSAELVRLGALLRDVARRYNVAVVVANQVADRFAPASAPRPFSTQRHGPQVSQESPLAARSMPPPAPISSTPSSSMPVPFSSDSEPPAPPVLDLDHQQRWFTGWGDEPRSAIALKTPSLGLVWSTQIACRVVLFKRPVYGRTRLAAPLDADDYDDAEGGEATLKSWRRWMKVVFAPHVAASGQGLEGAVEFEVTMGGLLAVPPKKAKKRRLS